MPKTCISIYNILVLCVGLGPWEYMLTILITRIPRNEGGKITFGTLDLLLKYSFKYAFKQRYRVALGLQIYPLIIQSMIKR